MNTSPPAARSSRATVLLAVILFLASLAFYASYCNRGLLLADEGSLVHAAQRIVGGEVPYRDFYHFYAPGSFYIVAGLFRLFGESFLLTRFMWVVVRAVINVLVFLVALRFMPRRFAILPVLVVLLVPGPWFKSYYGLASLFSLWLILRYAERGTAWTAAAAGGGVALALLLRQDVGLAAACVLAIALAARPITVRAEARRWVRLLGHGAAAAAAAGAILVPVVLYFHAQRALQPLLEQMFGLAPSYTLSKWPVLIRKFSSEFGYPHQRIFFGLAPLFLLAGLLAAGIGLIRSRFDPRHVPLLLLSAMATAVMVPAYLPMAPIRFFQCSAPLWILVTALFSLASDAAAKRSSLSPRGLRLTRAVFYLAAVALCAAYTANILAARHAGLATTNYAGTITAARRNTTPFEFRGERIYLSRRKGRDLKALVTYIQSRTSREDPLIVFPNQSLLYYLCDRPNRSRFVGTFTLKYPDDAEDKRTWDECYDEARRILPPYIIVHHKFLRARTRHTFGKLLDSSYEAEARFGDLVVMARVPETARPRGMNVRNSRR